MTTAASQDVPQAASAEAVPSPQMAKDQAKKARLEKQLAETDAKIADTQRSLDEVNAELGPVDAKQIVQTHIKLLHQYNELKDIATGLFGLIAERRGVRVRDVYEEFGVAQSD